MAVRHRLPLSRREAKLAEDLSNASVGSRSDPRLWPSDNVSRFSRREAKLREDLSNASVGSRSDPRLWPSRFGYRRFPRWRYRFINRKQTTARRRALVRKLNRDSEKRDRCRYSPVFGDQEF
jgi:hypothetical protein